MQHHRLAIVFTFAAAAGLAGCAHGASQRGPAALNVDVAAAQRRNIATYTTLDGQIAPLEESTLSFQQSGPIVGIYANVGDAVARGPRHPDTERDPGSLCPVVPARSTGDAAFRKVDGLEVFLV